MVSRLLPSTVSSPATTSMLSVIRRTASQILSAPTEEQEEDWLSWEAESTLSLNLDALHGLVTPLSRISWSSVASACTNAVVPVFRTIHKTWCDDVNDWIHFLAELESINSEDQDLSVCETAAEESLHPQPHPLRTACSSLPNVPGTPASVPRRRRMSDPKLDEALVIKNEDPSIPTIVITPCPTLPRDRSCLVPYQDVLFGNRLAVPMHPVVNDVFPPLLPKPAPHVDRWRFKDGHWWAVLPPPEEQMMRGMFSRPVSRRRRAYLDAWTRSQRSRRSLPKQASLSHTPS